MSDVRFPAVGFDKGRLDLQARFSRPNDPDLEPGDVGIEVRADDPRDPQNKDYVVRAESCRVEIHRPNDGGLLDVVTGADRLRVMNALSVTLLNAKAATAPTTAGRLANAVEVVRGCMTR